MPKHYVARDICRTLKADLTTTRNRLDTRQERPAVLHHVAEA